MKRPYVNCPYVKSNCEENGENKRLNEDDTLAGKV